MLFINATVLFFTALFGGLVVIVFPQFRERSVKWLLSFGGAYLFSITIVHLIPELFSGHTHQTPAFFLLLGFFLQVVLDFFSQGVEHGHIHHTESISSKTSSITLLVGLGIHAFLEGILLAHPSSLHADTHTNHTLLIGIVLHKIPAAFALMSILYHKQHKRELMLVLLVIFAVSTPLGMFLSALFYKFNILSAETIDVLFALVAGSFLHISTTIFFESSPNHKFNIKRLVSIFLGAMVAVLLEFSMGH